MLSARDRAAEQPNMSLTSGAKGWTKSSSPALAASRLASRWVTAFWMTSTS